MQTLGMDSTGKETDSGPNDKGTSTKVMRQLQGCLRDASWKWRAITIVVVVVIHSLVDKST